MSASSFRMVCSATPVIRSVARIDIPSTRHPMTCALGGCLTCSYCTMYLEGVSVLLAGGFLLTLLFEEHSGSSGLFCDLCAASSRSRRGPSIATFAAALDSRRVLPATLRHLAGRLLDDPKGQLVQSLRFCASAMILQGYQRGHTSPGLARGCRHPRAGNRYPYGGGHCRHHSALSPSAYPSAQLSRRASSRGCARG